MHARQHMEAAAAAAAASATTEVRLAIQQARQQAREEALVRVLGEQRCRRVAPAVLAPDLRLFVSACRRLTVPQMEFERVHAKAAATVAEAPDAAAAAPPAQSGAAGEGGNVEVALGLSLSGIHGLEFRVQRRIAAIRSDCEARLAVRVSRVRQQCRDRYERRLARLRKEAKEYALQCVRATRRRMARKLERQVAALEASHTASAEHAAQVRVRQAAVQTVDDDAGASGGVRDSFMDVEPEALSPEQTARLLQSILRRSIPLADER